MERESIGRKFLQLLNCWTNDTRQQFLLLKIGEEVTFSHKDTLVITTIISSYKVHRVLVDDDSVVNIISIKFMVQMRIISSKLTPVKTPLIRIKGLDIPVKGAFELPVIIGTRPRCVSL